MNKEKYKKTIINLIEQADDINVLIKIYTVVKNLIK